MTPPPFLIPSLVWYGLAPLLGRPTLRPLVPALKTGWGGMLTSDEDVAQALLALDPALVLLNLAGYQALEVVIGVPDGAAATAAGDLVSVDMATMAIDRGTAHPWMPARGPGSRLALDRAALSSRTCPAAEPDARSDRRSPTRCSSS